MKTKHTIKSILFLTSLVILNCIESNAQNVGISETLINAHPSSLLELQSSERGFLITRLTTVQRNAIQNPAEALMIFNTTSHCLEIFVQGWHSIWCDTDTGFVCGTPVNDFAGNSYNTVQIGLQCWFAENLRYDNGCGTVNWVNWQDVGWCGYYNNDEANYGAYGLLYQWSAAMNGNIAEGSQGLCPDGWHIPSHNEWTQLERFICNDLGYSNCETEFPYNNEFLHERGTNEGSKLKTIVGWNLGNGTDDYGFSGLAAGERYLNTGNFAEIGISTKWWSSTIDYFDLISDNAVFSRRLQSTTSKINRSPAMPARGFSVRCIKH